MSQYAGGRFTTPTKDHRRRVSFQADTPEKRLPVQFSISPPTPGFTPPSPFAPQTGSYLRTFSDDQGLPAYSSEKQWRGLLAVGQLGVTKRVVQLALLCLGLVGWVWWTRMSFSDKSHTGRAQMEVDRAVQMVFGDAAVAEPDLTPGDKFLLPSRIMEQETKAQLHLHQLGLLALALNRTLVLPQLSGSRFGECSKRPFNFYYDPSALSSLGVRSISHAHFISWTESQPQKPTTRVVAIAQGVEAGGGNVPEKQLTKEKLCLDRLRVEVDTPPLVLYAPWRFHQWEQERVDSVGAGLIDSLGAKASESDVLAVHYSLRHPLLTIDLMSSLTPDVTPPLPFAHFPPAPIWTELASSIVARLGPFVGIHWRLETLPTAHLPACATSLVDQLVALKEEHPSLATIYLATDYPLALLDGSLSDLKEKKLKANSDTFTKSLTLAHHVAFHSLVDDLNRRLPSLHLTSYGPELETIRLPPSLAAILAALPEAQRTLNELDSGIPSLIDKLVVQQANVFLAGISTLEKVGERADRACGKVSSYTEEIVDGRAKARDDGAEELWNEVERFSTDGKWDDTE